MRTYQIEVLWTCSICEHASNRGLKDRYCCNCGHKKDDSDAERLPDDVSEAAALSGELKQRAEAGPDWVCKYCQSLQNELNKCCGNCGATERGTAQRQETILPPPSPPATFAPAATDVAESDPEFVPPRAWRLYALAAAVLVALGCLGWWLFTPHIVTAKVVSADWRHDTVIDRYAVQARDGFYPPGDAFDVVPMGLRHHHYDRVHVGSHQESYSDRYACGDTCSTSAGYTTCRSNKNGSATCTQHSGTRSCSTKYCTRTAYRTVQDYRDVSRQQVWYAWRAWDWAYNRTVTRAGHNIEPSWPPDSDLAPPAPLLGGERERSSRQAEYSVKLQEPDGTEHSIAPNGNGSFLLYRAGENFKLKATRAGSVEVLP